MIESAELTSGLPIERRRGQRDRRARLWRSLVYGGLNPRRRTGRRQSDHHRPIVDWHSPALFASAMLILVLCVLDGLLTLGLLAGGAREANPVMAALINGDVQRFAILKFAMTGVGVVTLVALARFRVFRVLRAETLLHAVLFGYLVLVVYEVVLLDRVG